jgi:thiamine biosynthesis lipoprotein
MSGKSSRRDFLRGRSAADALADSVQGARPEQIPADAGAEAASRSYVMRVSRRAMACDFQVCFNAGQYENDTVSALKALDLVEELEDQISVFREASELSCINRAAHQGAVEVEPGLFGLLELSLELYRVTDGAFDITSAPLWRTWGFARRSAAIPADDQLAKAKALVGCHLVELDATHKTVRFRKAGVELNLGSIGKGYALDRGAEVLRRAGIRDFLFHGGHSSVLAAGSRMGLPGESGDGAQGGWRVGLPHPLRRGARLGEIRLRHRALATSSSTFQYFRHRGKRYGHVLDPRTGWPAEGVLSAIALAPQAAVADALSTAFYVMGPDRVGRYCKSRPELAAVLVCPAARGPGVDILSFGLEEDDLRLGVESSLGRGALD